MTTFILIHSPLVGPGTWQPVAEALAQRGWHAVVPMLTTPLTPPFWAGHVASVVRAVQGESGPFILVGHSGAGALLPITGAALQAAVQGYIFVDADLPRDGASRLDRFADDAERAEFCAAANTEGLLPTWTDTDLAEVIPVSATRRRFVAELRPMPLAVYEEPLPVPSAWLTAPCAYVHLSAPYDAAAREAEARGWPLLRLAGTHFHLLNDPAEVAEALAGLANEWNAKDGRTAT